MNILAGNMLFFVIAVAAFSFGLFLFRYPLRAFEFQRRFYALINWRIEPISFSREIRNTKIMGVILMAFVMGCLIYVIAGR